MFLELRIAIDMGGCPNRCKHCYCTLTPNVKMSIDDLHLVYELFNPFTKKIGIYSWYREPDYLENYQELYEIENKLSDSCLFERYELASFYRIVRDPKYLLWLNQIGVKKVQLTFFGLEKSTDYFVGRIGAFKELIKATNLLIENNIIPRWQIFINKKNIDEMDKLVKLIQKEKFEEKVASIGGTFEYFSHPGSPMGENLKNIAFRLTDKDLTKIPEKLKEKSISYLKKNNPYGVKEKQLYQKYFNSNQHLNLKSNKPVFYVDFKYNVYPNVSAPNKWWCLGNIKKDAIVTIIKNYEENILFAFKVCEDFTIGQLVQKMGNENGTWLFDDEEYLIYLLDLYCQKYYLK